MEPINIAGKKVGRGHPTFIIAEAGINHNGSLDSALRLIDAAAEAGCDAVKFQKRCPRMMLSREAYDRPYQNGGHSYGRTYGEHRERLELSEASFLKMNSHAHARGILFMASAWDEESSDFIDSLGVPAFKIGSPDLTNLPLCAHIARKAKPVILSTGMSDLTEVEAAVECIRRIQSELILLQCVSIYPAPPESVRLPWIQRLRTRFQLPVGYSGHEHGGAVSIAAVALGACVIEKHLSLDRSQKGGDHHFSLEPMEFAHMVREIRFVERALLDGEKELLPEEIPFRSKLAKSVVTTRPIRVGERIDREMLTCKSPATGLSPLRLDALVGKIAAVDMAGDAVIRGTETASGEPRSGDACAS